MDDESLIHWDVFFYVGLTDSDGFRLQGGFILFCILALYAGLADLCALGVIFAGGVVIVQRLRGRIEPAKPECQTDGHTGAL